jgi:hypothetical protein
MEKKIKSEGKCIFCEKTFAKAGINRHLKTHLTQIVKTGKPGLSYYLKIEQDPKWGVAPYFLYLWVSSDMTLDQLDEFLRNIWLDCCGHMSSFNEKKKPMGFEWNIDDDEYGIKMSKKAKKLFKEGMVLDYEYDFGSSTNLCVTVVEELLTMAEKPITLLSRNEPLAILCDTCKTEPAVELCAIHNWGEDYLFCKKCAKKHAKKCDDFADYSAMPVVNSPRMGICGYEGGTIDLERDKIFSK